MRRRSQDDDATRFGPVLREFRRRSGMTQRELAGRTGVSMGAIRDLEQGRARSPKRDSVRAIATALGLSRPDVERLNAAAVRVPRADGPGRSGPLDRCLTIARDAYPFIEARALVCLATAARDTTAAAEAAERAASIAASCGFRLLEKQARAALQEPVPR